MTRIKKCSLLETLLSRGDQIDIIKGRLVITPVSKQPVPKKWLSDNSTCLLVEIATLLDINVYIYDSNSTGNYGKHKSSGVTLQFINLTTGEDCYVTFIAELSRSRTSKSGNKGSSLPKGQFRIGKKYKFYKFWLSTGLRLPPRLSSFHDYMGNLKQLFFIPSFDHRAKIKDKIIPLLNLSHSEILVNFSGAFTNNNQTNYIQQPDNSQTRTPYSGLPHNHNEQGLTLDKGTGLNNYELSKQGSAVISIPLPDIKKPVEQTIEEWISDWENS